MLAYVALTRSLARSTPTVISRGVYALPPPARGYVGFLGFRWGSGFRNSGRFGAEHLRLRATREGVGVRGGTVVMGGGGEGVLERHTGVRTFVHDGWVILVGKNASDNDRLSTKIGNPEDFWFHVHGAPGSHVVVRNPTKESDLPREVKTVAAGLAAWYSKSRKASKANVHYTKCKFVRKIPGSPVGQVLLSNYKPISTGPVNPESVSKPKPAPKSAPKA
ncbi:hypothetical protein AAMO2058_001428700 [Amorphochlora amoebiformis]